MFCTVVWNRRFWLLLTLLSNMQHHSTLTCYTIVFAVLLFHGTHRDCFSEDREKQTKSPSMKFKFIENLKYVQKLRYLSTDL